MRNNWLKQTLEIAIRDTHRLCTVGLFIGLSLSWSAPAIAGKGAVEVPPAVSLKPAKPFASLSTKIQKQLLKGEAPVHSYQIKTKAGKSAMIAESWVIIKKPVKTVFAEMIKFNERYQYMPNCVESKIKKKFNPRTLHVYQVTKIFWSRIPVNIRVKLTPFKKITWSLMKKEKNGIKDNLGYWVFESLDKGKSTLISYALYTDTGRSVPRFIKRMLLNGSLPKVLQNVRKRILSGGKWKK